MKSTIPRIPHLPGSNVGPDDLQLSIEEARPFLEERAVVSEKTDGISLNIRLSAAGAPSAGLKADWKDALGGRVRRAAELWVRLREDRLRPLIEDGSEIYGEWLWHRLSVPYETLPSAAVLYSIRDRGGRLMPRPEALAKLEKNNLPIVEPLFEGVIGKTKLADLCGRSRWGRARSEGLIVEIIEKNTVRWAKWVRHDYRQPSARDLTGEHNRVVED